MIFNSFVFFVFLFVVVTVYRRISHAQQNRFLLVASYVFYGYWDYRFLSLIFISTLVDWALALWITHNNDDGKRRRILLLSVILNLGFLGFFKYYGFFVAEANALLVGLGFNDSLPVLKIVLPVGISFYTFQSLSYTIDVYRRKTEATPSFLDFALYVSFFPQLVAGPIERSKHLLSQIQSPRATSAEYDREGIYLILFGLFKKVVVADNCAAIANHVFSQPTTSLSAWEVLLGVYAFAFQIYGDFSGYSSIAQGSARLLGFRLSWNFRIPYLATNPSDFWKRWHISLSTWLRDYLYVPLGGNRKGTVRTYVNLSLTMLLGGLWHGAAWTFIAWGAIHGLLLIIYRFFPTMNEAVSLDPDSSEHDAGLGPWHAWQVIIFFQIICLTWLFFRADSLSQVVGMLATFGGDWRWTEFSGYAAAMLAVYVVPVVLYELWLERSRDQLALLRQSSLVQCMAVTALTVSMLFLPPLTQQTFIYFQF